MNLFVAFDSMTATGSGLLCEGSVPVSTAIAGGGDAPLREMAAESKVGRLRRCSVVDGVLRVALEIWDRIAVRKAAERVYRGLCLVCIPAEDGSVTVERAALVDHPLALNKGAGPHWAALAIEKGFAINLRTVGKIEFGKTADPITGRPVDPREQRAADEPAIAAIKASLRQVRPVGDRPFLEWYTSRSGR